MNTHLDRKVLYDKFFEGALCLIPIVSVLVPRALVFIPLLIAVLGIFSFRYIHGHWPAFSRLAFAWMGALCVLMVIWSIWSIDPDESMDRTIKTIPVLFGGPLLLGLCQQQQGAYFKRWFPYAVLIAGAICLVDLYADAPIYDFLRRGSDIERVNMSGLNRNVAAFFYFTLVALFILRASENKSRYALGFLITAAMIAALLATDSQSVQLAVLVAAVFYFIFPVNFKAAWVALGSALTALIFTAPWVAQKLFHTLALTADSNSWMSQGYAASRMEIWDFVSRRALQHPWIGHGVEATDVIKDFDTQMLYHKARHVLHPHNFMLQLWIEFGVIGPLFAAAFLLFILYRIHKLPPVSARACLAMLFAIMSVASTGYGLWQGMWLGAYGVLFAYIVLIFNQDIKKAP